MNNETLDQKRCIDSNKMNSRLISVRSDTEWRTESNILHLSLPTPKVLNSGMEESRNGHITYTTDLNSLSTRINGVEI